MDVQLFRIDDRLIHGQVVLGWARPLESNRIVLCDDEVENNEWEKELYISCVPANLNPQVFNIPATTEFLKTQVVRDDRTIVLVKEPKTVVKIVELGYTPGELNLGGMHFAGARRKYLPYVFLNDSEIADLNWLLDKGIRIYCQDVPTSRKYDITEVINGQK